MLQMQVRMRKQLHRRVTHRASLQILPQKNGLLDVLQPGWRATAPHPSDTAAGLTVRAAAVGCRSRACLHRRCGVRSSG